MMHYSAMCLIILATLFLAGSSHCFIFPDFIRKCEAGDDECFAESLTCFIQRSPECPEMGIPKLDPYEVAEPYTLHSVKLSSLLSIQAYWTNITIDGIDKLIVQEIRGFQPDQPITEICLKFLLPKLTVQWNTNGDLKALLLSIKTRGSVLVNLENVEIQTILTVDVVQRNGEDCMLIRDTSLTTNPSYFKINYRFQNVPADITSVLSGVANSNWRILKPLTDAAMNRFIGETLQSILQPIFDKFTVSDAADGFFSMNSSCETENF